MAWLRYRIAVDRLAEHLHVSREEAWEILRTEGIAGRVMIRCCTRGGTSPPQALGGSPLFVRVGARMAVPILEAVLTSCDPDDMPGRGYLEFFEPDVEHIIAMRAPRPEHKPPTIKYCSAEKYKQHSDAVKLATGKRPSKREDVKWAKDGGYPRDPVLALRDAFNAALPEAERPKPGSRKRS